MKKPRIGAEGQPQGRGDGGKNPSGGGAYGQPAGSLNRPCKPVSGAPGQPTGRK